MTTVKNAHVKTAKVTQSGNEELGMKEKNLYYLVIEGEKGRIQINVGEKTYEGVKEATGEKDAEVVKIMEAKGKI